MQTLSLQPENCNPSSTSASTPPKPAAPPPVIAAAIPDSLKERKAWVGWKYELRDEKWTKIPKTPGTGWNAKSNIPATWVDFETALRHASKYDGLGIMFDEELCGFDFDKCRDPKTGEIEPWVLREIEILNSYTEISPSGTGVHVLAFATLPPGRRRNDAIHVEAYGPGSPRYFTCSGAHLEGTPTTIERREVEFADVHARLIQIADDGNEKRTPPPPLKADGNGKLPAATLDDAALLVKARASKNGADFTRLWGGGYPEDESAGDLALCSHLAFWTNGDRDRIDRLFRMSGRMREKWNRHDYRTRTIDKATDGKRDAYGNGKVKAKAAPTIVISTTEHEVTSALVSALATSPAIYNRGGRLVHIVRGGKPPGGIVRPPNTPSISVMPHARLRDHSTELVQWMKLVGGKGGDFEEKPTHPPTWAIEACMARGEWPGIRYLETVVEAPYLRPDGSIGTTPGYDSATGLFFAPIGEVDTIPVSPTRQAAERACLALQEVVADFPFARGVHLSSWVASLLTPFARHAFPGPSPLFLGDANTRGCGKTLLFDLVATIYSGRPMTRMVNSEDDAEMRKRITALALAGDPLVCLDNVAGKLGCQSLDAMLTGTTWSDRILGKSENTPALPLLACWYATANNVSIGADLTRRVLHIRLESPLERPEERENLTHPHLLAWVRENRPRLAAAALTVLAGYCAAGRPSMRLKPWGSFEGWSDLVRQAVTWTGLPDPVGSREELLRDADTDANVLRDLIEGWQEVDPGGVGMTIAAALRIVEAAQGSMHERLRTALGELVAAPPGKLPSLRSLGMRFHHLRGRVVDGKALSKRDSNRGAVWFIRSVGSMEVE